jgi:hypothetical protein
MAIGTMGGALLSARRSVPGMALMGGSAAAFGIATAIAAMGPGPWTFAIVLSSPGWSHSRS